MKVFKYQVKLNITNGFGNFVLREIHDANVSETIENKLNPNGKVINVEEKWDSGTFSHDLYLTYTISIHTYRVIKQNTNKWVAKFLKYTMLQDIILGRKVRNQIEESFKEQLRGNELFVVFKNCIQL